MNMAPVFLTDYIPSIANWPLCKMPRMLWLLSVICYPPAYSPPPEFTFYSYLSQNNDCWPAATQGFEQVSHSIYLFRNLYLNHSQIIWNCQIRSSEGFMKNEMSRLLCWSLVHSVNQSSCWSSCINTDLLKVSDLTTTLTWITSLSKLILPALTTSLMIVITSIHTIYVMWHHPLPFSFPNLIILDIHFAGATYWLPAILRAVMLDLKRIILRDGDNIIDSA